MYKKPVKLGVLLGRESGETVSKLLFVRGCVVALSCFVPGMALATNGEREPHCHRRIAAPIIASSIARSIWLDYAARSYRGAGGIIGSIQSGSVAAQGTRCALP